MKNWRPITLSCVDLKLASACIANRIKPVLRNIISETQKGFLKGRYIGECTRIIFDLLDKLEDDIPGLLVLTDFEKAFDTIEWSFIEKSLEFFGFGITFKRWIKAFYCDITSATIYNGHVSEFFNLERGVRQGDPLSPYLFILVLELLSAAINNDPDINGVKINDSEFLLSQYADDSSLLLDGNEKSLSQSLSIFDKFSQCAGLKVNLDKTEAIWIGSKTGSQEKLLPEKKLSWNYTGKFKLLGICFDLFQEDKTLINFTEKVQKVKHLLNTWCYRELTYIGKITVIKTLALPILVQIFTVLPNPPQYIFKEIQDILFKFLWDGKNDKITRNVLINEYEEGGIKMPHIESFCYALKMSWIHKLLDPLNHSPWKVLLLNSLQKFGGDRILYLGREGMECLARKLNPFWKDVFMNYSKILKDQTVRDGKDVLSQSIWLNPCIKIGGQMCVNAKCCENNVFFVNDLVSNNRKFYSFEEFQVKYNIRLNFVEYYGILSAIPLDWRQKITEVEKLDVIENKFVEKIKKEPKLCRYFQKIFVEDKKELPLNSQNKWEKELNVHVETWNIVYRWPFIVTKDTKLQNFQYKLVHRILSCNAFLYKCGLIETEFCTFCSETNSPWAGITPRATPPPYA